MLIYPDSSVLLAWLKGEDTPAGVYPAIFEMVREAESDKKSPKYRFVLSPIVLAEIWPRLEYKPKYNEFLGAMKSFQVLAVGESIAREVARVRHILLTHHNVKLSQFDAVHVATAIISGAQCLCSLDNDMLHRKKEIENLASRKMKVVTPQEVPGISSSLL